MGPTKGKKGLIKLVHPGGYVELHKKPISAAEVMKKNPRHSVTRPDVFQYPWIVVKPESFLHFGRVYYIVPNRTIYKLIKGKGYSVQLSLQHQSPIKYEHRHLLEEPSPSKLSAGGTPKHKGHCQDEWQQFQASPQEDSCSESFDRSSQYECVADMMTKYQSAYQEFKLMSATDFMSDVESPDGKGYHTSEVSCSTAAAFKQNDAVKNDCKKQVMILKPCLRKQDSARKLLQLKVSFSLPTNCEEWKRKALEPRTELSLCFTS